MNHRSLLPLVILLSSLSVEAQTQFQLREPHLRSYTLEPRPALRGAPNTAREPEQWLAAHPDYDPAKTVELGSRLLVKIHPGKDINVVVQNSPLQFVKAIDETAFIFQATDAMAALEAANELSQSPDVAVCVPVMRRPIERHAYTPNDPHLDKQWNLSNTTNGANLNIRPAWDITRGNGVTMAIVDDGVEMTHPELGARITGMPHHNFVLTNNNGSPVSDLVSSDSSKVFAHGTAVAGMAAAQGNNSLGIVGAAPEAKLASWVIFSTNSAGFEVPADGEQLMTMFQYSLNGVAIQNHSWGNEKTEAQEPIDQFAELGLHNAIENGRGGRGAIMVRSVGNYRYWVDSLNQVGRTILANANDDGYPSDRRVVSVAAVNATGRATRYSNPGACVLVAAPATEWREENDNSPDLTFPSLFMVDRQGAKGYNTDSSSAGDYTFSNNVVIGTSFTAPQISGLVGLMLSVNTNLTYRDVQQILILSARHFDLTDPDLATNGAGLVVSHNVGFGIPDANEALSLAKNWIPVRPLRTASLTNANSAAVIDDGLRVIVSNAPPELEVIASSPTTGVHADAPTAMLPLVDVGQATIVPAMDLTGKAALIQRGGATFAVKIQNVAQAGAAAAIIFNNSGTTERLQYTRNVNVTLPMTDTDYSPIPAVFINKQNGDALRNFNSTNPAYVQLKLLTTNFVFNVTNQLSCEHIAVEVDGDNITSPDSRRGDIRITLVSPSGTRSVLQRLNTDTNRTTSPAWVYHSTHHFFENSAGTWTVEISDEAPGATATIRSVVLRVYGTEMDNGVRYSDFDGNDATDLLFQNPAGKLAAWLMKPEGTNFLRSSPFNNTVAAGWRVVGVADFDQNSTPDILFQHNNTQLAIWFMNGTNRTSTMLVRGGTAPGTGWKAVATADFNTNSFPDILFQHTSGKLAVWFQNGAAFTGGATLKSVAMGWNVVGVADLGLDGYNDILFQNAAGKFALWNMKGTAFVSSEMLVKSAAAGWSPRSLADINRDGKTDIVFQNTTTGAVAVWYMNGKTFLSSGLLNGGKSASPWQLLGPK